MCVLLFLGQIAALVVTHISNGKWHCVLKLLSVRITHVNILHSLPEYMHCEMRKEKENICARLTPFNS